MNRMLGRAILLGLVATLTTIGVATATSGAGATPTNFARGTLQSGDNINTPNLRLKFRTDVDVFTQAITIAPGGHTGWHSHPGPVFVTIASGTMTFIHGDDPACTPILYGPGKTFIDEGGGHIHIARNLGATDLVLYATYLLPVGATPRIDVPDPGNCPA